MRILIISSGSKANAALVIKGGSALLIDCGVSYRRLRTALSELCLDESIVSGVFITHSHSDHIKGLASVHKALNTEFYSAVDIEHCNLMSGAVTVGGFDVDAFKCSHDVPCVGYRISHSGESVCFATDTGVVTDEMRIALEQSETVVLESNHDIDMLRFGTYPQSLKQRILSDKGHLSNADCAAELIRLAAHGRLRRAVLAHISEHNNTPLLARKSAEDELKRYGYNDIQVIAASDMLEIEL